MVKFKPYLFLIKKANVYELNFAIACKANQTIESIDQQASSDNKFWDVFVVISDTTQLVNAPETLVFSSRVEIDAEVAEKYKTIRCSVVQKTYGNHNSPSAIDTSTIDFEDI